MDDNYTRSEFPEDDLQASADPLDGNAQSSVNITVSGKDGLFRNTASGSSRVREFAVAKTIAAFELTMLVLTGRNLTLVERSPDQ